MHRSRSLSTPLACSLVLLVSGCEVGPVDPATGAADGVSAVQFSDIPVPAGMKLLERFHRSDSLEIGEYRYGNFVYTGLVPPAEVSLYMRERMPLHSWKLEEQSRDEEAERLRFVRGIHAVDCTISRDRSSTKMEIAVRTRPQNK